ncbi:hypothetical protein [Brumimicrobium aurantiacum]|uniref:PLAT domain-containing protein n=1 Tax=Brumimicrobium aurantiacum TaxID=1737063 RepID=A0A3E1EXV1_9FLAO|nr:hypothetical protein [Brumimicrobium aurantiacum]RFC54390.1 hypothetical protein DXU93_08160 [Brumimicrobium aurantiacum]
MNKSLLFTLLAVALFFTSCNKCDPTNSHGGEIIEDAIVKVIGYQAGENYITDQSNYDKLIEVSFDGGLNYSPVNFSKYAVFSLTTTASCSSGYDRNITLNKSDSTIIYNISITECETCKNNSTINNWVLTESIPSYYDEVIYEVDRN